MAGKVPNAVRDQLITAFRGVICAKLGIAPFEHQAKWWSASDGFRVGGPVEPDDSGIWVTLPDNSRQKFSLYPRQGGRARVIADLGAFKTGKSYGSGIWAASFAAVPDARVNLVGNEYDICAPEFDYICEALLSGNGMGLKYDSLQNRPRDGKMWLDLPNGCRYEARSWERKESLKGKEIDAYVYCEAYQLPGLECYTSFNQNLRAREGYAIFATTPDRPWVQELHDRAHSGDRRFEDWECICGVDASVNPLTYDPEQRETDKELMTREKYAIHYGGQLGDFVGRVFNYQRGGIQFNRTTHPRLFVGPESLENLVVPDGWTIETGADTGTYYTALSVMFSPEGDAFVIGEWPNYRYVAGTAERDEDIAIPGWTSTVKRDLGRWGARPAAWADKNSQFKRELAQYGLSLLPSTLPLETRTEITREYFQKGRIWLAPWLQVLPAELEWAAWPEETSAAGKFARVKDRDHTLDCLEHVLSRRPQGRITPKSKNSTWLEGYAAKFPKRERGNSHLGKF